MARARDLFNGHFERLRRDAEVEGRDLAEVLAKRINNRLLACLELGNQDPKQRLLRLTEIYRRQYLERVADAAIEFAESRGRVSPGQAKGAATVRNRAIARKLRVLEKALELIKSGHRTYGLNKAIAKALNEPVSFVKTTRKNASREVRTRKLG